MFRYLIPLSSDKIFYAIRTSKRILPGYRSTNLIASAMPGWCNPTKGLPPNQDRHRRNPSPPLASSLSLYSFHYSNRSNKLPSLKRVRRWRQRSPQRANILHFSSPHRSSRYSRLGRHFFVSTTTWSQRPTRHGWATGEHGQHALRPAVFEHMLEGFSLCMMLHFGLPCGRLHVTNLRVADDVQVEAPGCYQASVLPREGPRPS
jgi:hypothetical protein